MLQIANAGMPGSLKGSRISNTVVTIVFRRSCSAINIQLWQARKVIHSRSTGACVCVCLCVGVVLYVYVFVCLCLCVCVCVVLCVCVFVCVGCVVLCVCMRVHCVVCVYIYACQLTSEGTVKI